MKVKDIQYEWYQDYKKPSMFIAFPLCTFKCEKESEVCCCQNSSLAKHSDIEVNISDVIERYASNPITNAVVMGGLEPLDSFDDVWEFIISLRAREINDDIVIYTGYNKDEIPELYMQRFSLVRNIFIKFGRFIPNQESHFDEILGVELASPNQYAERIS